MSPSLRVQFTVTSTVPLTSSDRPTQEREDTEGGPEKSASKSKVMEGTNL